jgi:hypothetical protein
MRRINYVYLFLLRREAHYQFLKLFDRFLASYPEIKKIVEPYYDEFIDLLMQEEALVDSQKGSNYTMQIVAADHRDDRLLFGINNILKAARRHFDQKVVEAAIVLQNRMKPFGDIIKKSYEEEAAAIRILLADFQGEHANEVELVGLTSWINELAMAVADFEQLLKQRKTEKAEKPLRRMREVRKAIEVVYQKMIDHITAVDTLDETGLCTPFINELNVQIDAFNNLYHQRMTKDIKMTLVKPVPVQKYSGKPITPLLEIIYGETELVLSKDYTLAYNKNIEVGNAEIIVRGKGEYEGKMTITFFIEK